MTLGDQPGYAVHPLSNEHKVHVITDGWRAAPIRTSMLQIHIKNEDWICRNGDYFEIHDVGNRPLLLRWHVDILMETVHNPQIRRISSDQHNSWSTMMKKPIPVLLPWSKEWRPHCTWKSFQTTKARPQYMEKKKSFSVSLFEERIGHSCTK